MRQRASTKTQRRLKQQQRDPYALTDDVYSETPTFHVGGLVTAVGVLQLVVALTLSGFMFGGVLLFCAALVATLGLMLLRHGDNKGHQEGLGLKQALGRLLELRRSVLDYSLTLSIAQSHEFKSKELQIAVVPTSPTPQNVMATMALKQEPMKKKMKAISPFETLKLKTLPTIKVQGTDDLQVEKPRANSDPPRNRPLLSLKPKVIATQKKKQVEKTPMQLKTLKNETKTAQIQEKTQPKREKKSESIHVAVKKKVVPKVLSKAEPKCIVTVVQPKKEIVKELPKPKLVETAPVTVVVEPFVPEAIVPVIAPMSIFPEQKSMVTCARGEPAIEKELVVTRKVLLYVSPEGESMMNSEEQEMEQETEELEQELELIALSFEAFPPLSPPIIPQSSMHGRTNSMEPNFLMDIELEPLAKPENKLISFGSLRIKPVNNSELRTMLDELEAMKLELDAVMANCTSLLNGEGDKRSSSLSELEPEEEPIFCF